MLSGAAFLALTLALISLGFFIPEVHHYFYVLYHSHEMVLRTV